MKTTEQNIAIAEALGYVQGSALGYSGPQETEIYAPDPNGDYRDLATWEKRYRWIPGWNPCADLNAMAEAEGTLDWTKPIRNAYNHTEASLYQDWLSRLIEREGELATWAASAKVRAEAFLRVKGKWIAEPTEPTV